MDHFHEEKLENFRRIETIIKNFEETEAKTNEAIRLKSQSHQTSFGPANDLLRYMYILEKQYQEDTHEIRTKAREDLLEYVDQFRLTDDVVEEDDNDDDQPSDEQQQPTPIIPLSRHPSTTTFQPPSPGPSPSQPPPFSAQLPSTSHISGQSSFVTPFPTQPPSVSHTSTQPSLVTPFSTQPSPVTAVPTQPLITTAPTAQIISLAPVTDPAYIRPETLVKYEELLVEAEQYERRYKTIDAARKKQLASRLKETMNKLRLDTFATLTDDLLRFLTGQSQQAGNQTVRIENKEEHLLCLSMLASLTFNQLLGGDLDKTKTEIFLPLISKLSADEKQKEFAVIFRERLHKKCPYTVPYNVKREATMTDKQYHEAMGYIEIKEGLQPRLQTEAEFLLRMSGLIRLFCKLLVSRGPPFDNKLDYAWHWIADVLNLQPRPNLTAMSIRIFLDETGQSMLKEYGQQFIKMLKTIEKKYIPILEKETNQDQIVRLRHTLDTLNKFTQNVTS